MVKVSVRLDTRYKHKDGTYPLKLAVARKHTFYVPVGIDVLPQDWNDEQQEITNMANRKLLNAILRRRRSDAETKLLQLQASGKLRSLTDKQVIAMLQKEDENELPHLFKDTYEQFIALKQNSSTQRIYARTVALVAMFADYNSLTFEEMTVRWLNDFKLFLLKYSPKPNGRSIHFRNLRAVFNFAIKQETITCYPFRNFEFEYEETEKRSLSLQQMRDFINLPCAKHEQRYKDCFLLTFYFIGINCVDLSDLADPVDGRLQYLRSKTHKVYNIKVEPEAQALLDKYKGKQHLLCWFDTVKKYTSFANKCDYWLGEMGKRIGVDNLTLYWARHTWATFAYDLDIADDTITRSLGHSQTTGAQVTQVYIRTDSKKVDAANRAVIDYVLNNSK